MISSRAAPVVFVVVVATHRPTDPTMSNVTSPKNLTPRAMDGWMDGWDRRRHHASIPPVPHEMEGGGAGPTAWWRRFRRRAAQWVYAEAEEEKLPMLRQQRSSASNGNGNNGSPRRLRVLGAEPGMYLSPRARAVLLRREQEQGQGEEGEGSPCLPRSLPEAYHSIAVPRARPGEGTNWERWGGGGVEGRCFVPCL
jgi:hypothetical protein